MNLLLDTHTLIWWLEDHPTLSKEAREAIGEGHNMVFVSAASAWEIIIKKSLGKLTAPDDLEKELVYYRFRALPVTISHTRFLADLPSHHRDPFDRLLVAQAKAEGLILVTRDLNIRKYDIQVIKA